MPFPRPTLCFLVILLSSLLPGDTNAKNRPNVLLIIADDLGYSDLGCYGGEIHTPHLDQLAAEGMRFSQFYNAAVCVTTRAALYTGLYPRLGTGSLLREDMHTIGELLQAAGYRTGMTGKWHLGSEPEKQPVNRGFDEFYGLLSGCSSFFNPAKPDPDFYNGGLVRPFSDNGEVVTDFPDDYYATDAFTDHAIETIERFAKEGKQDGRPFFVNLNYTAPHFPLHALPEDIARYRGRYPDGYEPLRQKRYDRLVELGLLDPEVTRLSTVDPKTGDFRYDYEVTPWDSLSPETRAREEARMEVYAAMVDRLDQGIGRVLDALDHSGAADNTLILFLSDNGGCASWPTPAKEPGFLEYNEGIPVGDPRGYEFVGRSWGWAQNSPFRKHKVWAYEGGIRTPLIVRWPGQVKAGSISHQAGHVIDFMPTLLEIAGGSYPETRNGEPVTASMEGTSLLPILMGQQRTPPEFLAWSLYGSHAWREGDWKLVWNPSPPASARRWELYNLASDGSETTDLARKHPERAVAMKERWNEWAFRVGAKKRPVRP
ncbi:MAG: arylsulfatase [Verrucomicrobiales bacterium]|nr:arylsulfatase [Verrucomicrobiales bacterium]